MFACAKKIDNNLARSPRSNWITIETGHMQREVVSIREAVIVLSSHVSIRFVSIANIALSGHEEVHVRNRLVPILMAAALISTCLGCCGSGAKKENDAAMADRYLEIVSNDIDGLADFYQRVHGLSFGPPDPDLGHARVAPRADGTLVGIREPLAAHEQPIVRIYLAVEDIQQAVKQAEDSGAAIAYPPTQHGERGTFAIVIHGDVEHGLWQR